MTALKRINIEKAPTFIEWAITDACSFICSPCRTEARTRPAKEELTTIEAKKLISQIKKFKSTDLLVTGGDPLKRTDIYELISHAASEKVNFILNPAGTSYCTPEVLDKCMEAGLKKISISLDGHKQKVHDGFRKINGSHRYTHNILAYLKKKPIEVEINTIINRYNKNEFHNIHKLKKHHNITNWRISFLIPGGRRTASEFIDPSSFDKVFGKINNVQSNVDFPITIYNAPFFNKFNIYNDLTSKYISFDKGQASIKLKRVKPKLKEYKNEVSNVRGTIFINSFGEVYPHRYLTESCGNVREKSIVQIYKTAPLLKKLRTIKNLKGKCSYCEFKIICGGSRVRAYTITGDYFKQDPHCMYTPLKKRPN